MKLSKTVFLLFRCSSFSYCTRQDRAPEVHSLHYELHWLDVSERIQFRVATTVYRCLHMALRYLSEMCTPIGIATSTCRQGLNSVSHHQLNSNLVIPRVRRVTYGRPIHIKDCVLLRIAAGSCCQVSTVITHAGCIAADIG